MQSNNDFDDKSVSYVRITNNAILALLALAVLFGVLTGTALPFVVMGLLMGSLLLALTVKNRLQDGALGQPLRKAQIQVGSFLTSLVTPE